MEKTQSVKRTRLTLDRGRGQHNLLTIRCCEWQKVEWVEVLESAERGQQQMNKS